MLCAKFGCNWRSGSEEFFFYFVNVVILRGKSIENVLRVRFVARLKENLVRVRFVARLKENLLRMRFVARIKENLPTAGVRYC